MALHSDAPATYYATSISSMSLYELNTVLVYGLGALILIILPTIVISVYEMHQIKQHQQGGVDHILYCIGKIFVYSLLFMFFVMLIFMAMVGAMDSGVNPAYGIHHFFKTDWLNPSVMASLEGGAIAALGDVSKLESARAMVGILTLSRFVYILLLMSFFLIMMGAATSVVVSDVKKGQDGNVMNLVGGIFSSMVASVLVFWVLVSMTSQILNSILWFSNHVQRTSFPVDINIVNDLVALFVIGLNTIEAGIIA